MEMAVADFDGLALTQFPKVLREVFRPRHCRAADKNRHHPDVALQSFADFEPHEIARVVEATGPVRFLGGEPVIPDHGQQNVRDLELLLNYGDEIVTALDAVKVHEDVFPAEASA